MDVPNGGVARLDVRLLVATVAERRVFGLFTVAEPVLLRFGAVPSDWPQGNFQMFVLVRAIAEGLVIR